jgi:hypothetical protein
VGDPTAARGAPTGLLVCGATDVAVAAVRALLPDGLAVAGAARRADVPGAVTALAGAGGIVACGVDPWPVWDAWLVEASAAGRAAAGGPVPVWRVASWHRLPVLLDRLAEAARAGLSVADAHLLVTAPHAAGAAVEPADRAFLREVAEDLAARLDGVRPTIAFDRAPDGTEPTPPDIATVLTALAEAHGRRRVVRLSLDPGDPGDDAAAGRAAALGLDLDQRAVPDGTREAALVGVLTTVRTHEEAAS